MRCCTDGSHRAISLRSERRRNARAYRRILDSTPRACSAYVLNMRQQSFFPDQRLEASDEEVVAAFRVALERGGRLPRLAELYLNTVCAEHLVETLRAEGLQVVKQRSSE